MAPREGDQDALLGRETERAELDELIASVRQGISRSLVLLGDPGVGKSRLLQYVAESSADLQIVRVSGLESELRLGFAGIHRLVLPFIRHIDTLPAPQRDALLATFGMREGKPPARFLVGLGVLSLLAEVASTGPMVCIIDDAQWLDRESLRVLGFVARRLYADSVGLLFGARENSPAIEPLAGLPTRHLTGIDSVASHTLLQAQGPDRLSASVASRLFSDGEGNPLAMLEMLRHLTPDERTGVMPLPHRLTAGRNIDGYFLRQIAVLPPETRALLVLASAMPDDDPGVLWAAASALGIPPDAADAASSVNVLWADHVVEFRHPLIRSAVYNNASAAERRAAHAALAAVADSNGDPDRAAWHRAESTPGPDESVALDLERSAARAGQRGAIIEQAALLRRAAELSPTATDRSVRLLGAARAYLAAGDGAIAESLLDQATPGLDNAGRHLDVQRTRASIAVFFSRHKDAPAVLLEAVRTAAHPDTPLAREMLFDAVQAALVAREYTTGVTPLDVARRVLLSPRDTATEPTNYDQLLDGFATRIAGDYTAAVPLLRDAVATLFESEPQPGAALPATILGWFAADDVWDDVGRRALFERAADIERRHGALAALRITLAGLCTSQAWTGEMGQAEQSYFEAAEISELIGVPAPATTGVLLEVRAWQGREDESREVAAMTAEWGKERGAAILEIFAQFGLTVLDLGLGNYAAALRSGMRIFEDDPPGFGNRILPEIVEAGTRSGQRGAALEALDRLAERAPVSGTHWALGMLARSRALLAPASEAELHFQEAIDHLVQTSVRTELARTHLLYGEWLRRRKRRNDAQSQLRIAHGMFTGMGARGFASRTEAELIASGATAPDTGERAFFGLTAQEAQVSRLAATGSTNAEIAARMFLTTSTVEYHLSKVFRKLGVTSRRQLAAALT